MFAPLGLVFAVSTNDKELAFNQIYIFGLKVVKTDKFWKKGEHSELYGYHLSFLIVMSSTVLNVCDSF